MTALLVTYRDGSEERVEFAPLGALVARGSPIVAFGERPQERLLTVSQLAAVRLVDVDPPPPPAWTCEPAAKPKRPKAKAA
jgi:hypothetical protein